jgi:hypothetical protein
MQATKAAFCLGGMHQHCFSHGLSALSLENLSLHAVEDACGASVTV